MFILWKRDRGGEEGKEERESPADPMPSTEPDMGPNPMTLRTRLELTPRVRHSTNYTIQAPQASTFLKRKIKTYSQDHLN